MDHPESMHGDDQLSFVDGDDRSPHHATKRTRTRTGCLNCRRRRRKCDELKPGCLNCNQRGEECQWGTKITFKADNATQLDAEHPSMRDHSRKRPRHFKILNVTSQIEKGYSRESLSCQSKSNEELSGASMSSRSPETATSRSPHNTLLHSQILQGTEEVYDDVRSAWQSQPPSFDTPLSMAVSYSDGKSYVAEDEPHMQMDLSLESQPSLTPAGLQHNSKYPEQNQLTPQSNSEHNLMSNLSPTISREDAEIAAAELLALRYLPAESSQRPSLSGVQAFQSEIPPSTEALSCLHGQPVLEQNIFDGQDGIFLPGSVYQELHSTLRDHLIYTARSNAPTRHGTPELQQPDMSFFDRGLQKSTVDESLDRTEQDLKSNRSSKPPEVTPQREYVLWKTWIDEVAPWLDKFDNKRHFEHKIPMIAKTTPHLKNSILALCARQIESKERSKSSSESLSLYQEAIHLLLPELQTKGTAVIASCVILCVLEMMSCSPREWRRHLEGCANLLEAVGINGFVNGVEEALFWCFARMDVCGALISQDLTLIPVSHWASKVDLDSDIRLFRNPSIGFDMYANYAVFLCANCVTYLKNYIDRTKDVAASVWVNRWSKLMDLLDGWYSDRPEEMKPIVTIPGKEASPFPTVLYGNGPAVSGNQLYHTATLLMLQDKPAALKTQRKAKSIFWHARQICAISESNTHHGAWTNSIQPLWIAGKVMSHPSEHRAILNILERIERDLGWVTSWRQEDLKKWWGDSDE